MDSSAELVSTIVILAAAGTGVDRDPVWCLAVSTRSLGVFMLRTLSLAVVAVALAATACTAETSKPSEIGASPAAADKTNLSFGDTFQGMVDTTVSKPHPVDTSPSAFPRTREAWGVDVTFTNNAPQAISPQMFRLGATTGGRASKDVLDTQNGLLGMDTASAVAPGETVTVPLAFVGSAQDRNTVTVSSMDGSQTVVFR